jgi:hypothetical protein
VLHGHKIHYRPTGPRHSGVDDTCYSDLINRARHYLTDPRLGTDEIMTSTRMTSAWPLRTPKQHHHGTRKSQHSNSFVRRVVLGSAEMGYPDAYKHNPHRHRHGDYEPPRYLTRSCRSKRVYQENQGTPQNQKRQPHSQIDTWILTSVFRFAQTDHSSRGRERQRRRYRIGLG